MFLLAKSTGGRYVAVGCAADRLKIFHLNEKKDGTKYLVNLGGAYFIHMFNDETIYVIERLYPQVNWQTANDDEWPEEITKEMVEEHEKTQTNEPFSLLRPLWWKSNTEKKGMRKLLTILWKIAAKLAMIEEPELQDYYRN